MIATVLRRRAAFAALFAGATLLAAPALAGDRPATSEGAESLQAFFNRFLPAPPPGGSPLIAVKADGQHYLASADLAAMNGIFKAGGANVAYDPATLVLNLFQLDDGKWRVVQDALPAIVSHATDMTSVTKIDNYHQTMVIDPALAWFVSCAASADKGSMNVTGPTLEQAFDFGPLKADCTTTVNPDGSVSSTAKEDVHDIAFKVSGTDKAGKSVGASGRMGAATFNIGVDGLKSRKLFDLVALISAHRDDLAAHEGELKDALRPLAAPGLRFVEGGEASKVMFGSQMGAIALDGAKFALGVANAGPDSAIDTTISADGLSLPAGLLPPNATELTPSKIDLAFTVKGINLAAAAAQAIDSLHLGGPGPAISEPDSAKVSAALLGAGPMKIVIAPSHVVAPAIDVDVQGEVRYAVGKPSGAVTVRMRNFDKTMSAIEGLGPAAAGKALPLVAMAKGLAKTEPGGTLSWLIEVDADRSIKVNGLPLGKAPE
jgi:hypothetical protein